MRTVSYGAIQTAIAGFLGWDPNNLSGDEQSLINVAFNRRAQFGWESFFWPELTLCQQRYFAPVWNSTVAYAAGQQVYDPPTQAYYVALTGSTNQAPSDVNGNPVLAYWALLSECLSAANWVSGATYTQGNLVYYPNTDSYYQLYTTSTSSALPTDTTNWGLVPRLERTVGYQQTDSLGNALTPLGDVKAAWDRSPRTQPDRAQLQQFYLQDNGVRIGGTNPYVWLEFRTLPPTWTGAVWVSGNYAAGAQVYYNGDYYVALQTVTGQATTNTAYWQLIQVPYVLGKYITNGAYADVDSKTENNVMSMPSENDEAYQILEFEYDRIERLQGQAGQMNVAVSRNY